MIESVIDSGLNNLGMIEARVLHVMGNILESASAMDGARMFLFILWTLVVILAAFAFGTVRWWCIRKWKGKALWTQARDEYNRDITALIEDNIKLRERLDFYIGQSHRRIARNMELIRKNTETIIRDNEKLLSRRMP